MDFEDFASPVAPEREFAPELPSLSAVETMPLSAPRPQGQGQLAPAGAPPVAARAKAGLGILAAAAGLGIGGVLGGPLGAVAGLAGIGTVRNLYRSQGIASSDPAERGDATRSLALGVVGVAIVSYLGYKLYTSRKDD